MLVCFRQHASQTHPIPLLIADLILGKKVPLIVFRHKFYQKSLPVAHIFSFTII